MEIFRCTWGMVGPGMKYPSLSEFVAGLCQSKVTFLREFPALAFSDEKSIPLFQDFAGHYPTRGHDVREVSTVFASGRRIATRTWD